jgi:hypothetical protein
VNANNGRARAHGTHAVGKGRNRGLRVAHVMRCSFRSPAEFYLPADCGR